MADGDLVKAGVADSCCGSAPSTLPETPQRTALIAQAFRLEWMTIAWRVGVPFRDAPSIGAGFRVDREGG